MSNGKIFAASKITTFLIILSLYFTIMGYGNRTARAEESIATGADGVTSQSVYSATGGLTVPPPSPANSGVKNLEDNHGVEAIAGPMDSGNIRGWKSKRGEGAEIGATQAANTDFAQQVSTTAAYTNLLIIIWT